MANYNSYFPQTYAPYVYSGGAITGSVPTTTAVSSNAASPVNWVQGEAGARSINVPAGQTAVLMDSETNQFYVKSSDASGFPLPIRTFKYEEITQDSTTDGPAPSTYVTKDELDEKLKELTEKLKEDKSNGKFDI